MADLSIKKLAQDLSFDIVCDGGKKQVDVLCVDVNRPGLFLTGFHSHFDNSRVQVIGTAEYSYLMSIEESKRLEALNTLFQRPFPFMVLSNNVDEIPRLAECARKNGAVVFRSREYTATRLVAEMAAYLNLRLAPMQSLHAVLLDIYRNKKANKVKK